MNFEDKTLQTSKIQLRVFHLIYFILAKVIDQFDQWVKRHNTGQHQVVPVMLQIVPLSCKGREKLEHYNTGNEAFIEKLEPKMDISISRAGQQNRNYDVWVYKITNPADPTKVSS